MLPKYPANSSWAADLLSSPALLDVGTCRHIRAELGKDWCVLEGADCWQEEFASFITGSFHGVRLWYGLNGKNNGSS